LGRKPKNKFEDSIAFDEGIDIRVFDIEVPFVYKFTITPVRQTWNTELEYHIPKPEDVKQVTKDIEKQGYKVTKIEPSVRKMLDLCPRCHMRGTPKIEKKDAHDRRTRRPTHLGEIEKNEVYSERPEECWLAYAHSKNKKCRIRQYVNTPYPAYKKNDIPIEKYFFPYVISELKKGIFDYTSHSSGTV